MNRNDYRARVPDVDKRLEAERLYLAAQAAETAAAEAESGGNPEIEAKYDALLQAAENTYRARRRELSEQKDKDYEAANVAADVNAVALRTAADAAQQAWSDFDSDDFATYEDDEGNDVPERCALSGLALFEGDAVLEDNTTGEKVLKACLGVPLDADNDDAFALPVAEAAE